jgi:hypothetical protein
MVVKQALRVQEKNKLNLHDAEAWRKSREKF